MKQKLWFLLLIFALVGCNKDPFEDLPIDRAPVTGSIVLPDGSSPKGMEVVGVLGSQDVDRNGSFGTEVIECQDPQLLFVNDASGAPAMLYRGIPNAKKGGVEISAASTALALITMQPALASCKGADFDELCCYIKSLDSYRAFERTITKSMMEGRNVLDTNNAAVILALRTVSDDVFSSLMSSGSKNSFYGTNLDPIDFFVDGSTVTMQAMSVNPTYTGTVISPSGRETPVQVHSRSDYCVWDLVNNRTVHGEPVSFELASVGTYVFDLEWKNKYGWLNLGGNILSEIMDIIGICSLFDSDDIDLILEWIVPAIQDLCDAIDFAIDVTPPYDVSWWDNLPLKNTLIERGKQVIIDLWDLLAEWFPNKISKDLLKDVGKAFSVISSAEGLSNMLMRVGFAIYSPNQIKWSVVKFPNGQVGASDYYIEILSGNYQSGASGSLLPEDLVVKVYTAHPQSLGGMRVKFTPATSLGFSQSSGTVIPAEAITDGNGIARTRWKLGRSNPLMPQQVSATVVDQNGNSISNTVIFYATTTITNPLIRQLNLVSGDNQLGYEYDQLADPLTVRVECHQGPMSVSPAGQKVRFSVISGGGQLSASQVTVGSDGLAQVYWTLGSSNMTTQQVKAEVVNSDDQPVSEAVVFQATAMEPYTDLQLGLVAHYPFDGNAMDMSGHENHGSSFGVTSTTNRYGLPGRALHFGGIDASQAVHVPNSPSLQFSNAMSISMWFKGESRRGMARRRTGVSDNSSVQHLFAKDYDNGPMAGCIVYQQNGSTTLALTNSSVGVGVDCPINLNEWHHVVYVITNTNMKIYLDGRYIGGREENTSFTIANNRDLWFGRLRDEWYPFSGSLDDIRIYNRELSRFEVAALYHL